MPQHLLLNPREVPTRFDRCARNAMLLLWICHLSRSAQKHWTGEFSECTCWRHLTTPHNTTCYWKPKCLQKVNSIIPIDDTAHFCSVIWDMASELMVFTCCTMVLLHEISGFSRAFPAADPAHSEIAGKHLVSEANHWFVGFNGPSFFLRLLLG